jgi:hypothetical protein
VLLAEDADHRLAYLHTLLSLRLPSLDNRYLKEGKLSVADVKAEIDALVPFLSDQKSTVRYGSVREAWEAVWGTIGETLVSPEVSHP